MDYDNTTDPNHNTLNFSSDCTTCHTEDAWAPSTFDHGFYPLNGAHSLIANECNTCHNGDYVNTPNTCYGCHQTDYENTNNPNHIDAQFPTDCIECHDENAWSPAAFDHDGLYFPIYSGKHQDAWNECMDCHMDSGDYSIFSCIDCHEHNNENEVNNDHSEVNGYTFESNACLACHPNGN
jgi:hypothetical protein